MAKLEATVTYSKDGHKKKQRRWLDGTLKFDLESRFATLFGEDDKFIASGTIPSEVEIQDDSEEFILEAPSILVVISAISSSTDVLPQAAPPAAKENTRQLATTATTTGSGGAALRRSFAPPLLSNPSATTSSLPTGQRSLLHPRVVRQAQPQQQPPPPSTSGPSAEAAVFAGASRHSAPHRPAVKRSERSAEDILRLLGGNLKEAPKEAPKGTGDPAAAKRQRLVPFQEPPPPPQAPLHPSAAVQTHPNNTRPLLHQSNQQLRPLPIAVSGDAAAAPAVKMLPPPAPRPPSMNNNNSLASTAGKWNPRLNNGNNSNSTAVVPVHSSAAGNGPPPHPSRPSLGLTSVASASPLPGTVYFPSAQESSKPARRVVVPDRFSTPDAYLNAWEDSLYEEMTLKLAEVAKDFHAAAAGVAGAAGAASSSSVMIESAMRKARVPYYSTCELFIWKNYPGKQHNGGNFAGGRKKKNKNDSGYDDDVASDSASKPKNVYLILKSGRAKNIEYSKGDLWILSNHPFMKSGFDPGQPGDRNRAPWVAVARSLWFGPNQDGKFEIEFLSSKPSTLGRSTPVYAIKGPNASIELNILDLLRSPSVSSLPLLGSILGAVPLSHNPAALCGPAVLPHKKSNDKDNKGEDPVEDEMIQQQQQQQEDATDEIFKTPQDLAEIVIHKFKLNSEQATVVRHVATWSYSNNNNNTGALTKAALPPVCLIFGPFGCGKSSLLIAVLHLLLTLRKLAVGESNGGSSDGGGVSNNPLSESRILISAHTNVAVDRVLTGLMESGCTDFLRVGPLRRIDRSLLPYSLHASESKTHANAAAELKDMLREGEGKMSPTEEATLRAELAAMAAGAERKRKKMLKTCPVVGVTCCSSLLPVLENLTFDIVILDECSQIIEPLAMAPILRAKAKFLIAAGDPKQLPPVIANPPLVSTNLNPSSSSTNISGLLRPLFVRLSDLGATPHFLRQQYRCHPALSAIPNAQFYQGRLLDGCTADQRPCLLPGVPPAVFVDVRDGREQYVMRSTANAAEAHAVVRVVEKAIAAGVDPARVGVICFYRAQVQEILNVLHSRGQSLQAAADKAKLAKHASSAAQHQPREEDNSALGDDNVEEETENNIKSSENNFFTSIQVATVDAFQGAEKDIIILTTATTRPGAFIAEAARLNVALTRAKHHLVVVGCGQALERTAPAFAALIHAAKTTPGGYHVGNLK